MQVSVESPTKIEKRLTVIVTSQQVEEAFTAKLVSFAKKADIKGFRPGKVPVSYIKQRFGQDVRNEAINSVIQETLNKAIIQENLYPMSTPHVETKIATPGGALEYTATFEVLPEISAIHFKVDNLEKRVAVILENDIDKTIERLREQHVLWNKVDRPAQENDKVSGKFQMMMDDEKPLTKESMPLDFILKDKPSVFGWNVLEKLHGVKSGEEINFKYTLPQEAFLKGMEGKTFEFKIKIEDVSEPETPGLDEAFAKKLGIKSGDIQDLRAEIRKQLELNLNRSIKGQLKEQVFEKLMEQNPMDLPKSLIEKEAKHLHDESCSMSAQGHHKHSKEDEASLLKLANKRILLGLLVGELASQNKITASKERVNQYITEFASAFADADDYVRRLKADRQKLKEIETAVLEEQVVEKLLENVSIVEKEVSYEELINISATEKGE